MKWKGIWSSMTERKGSWTASGTLWWGTGDDGYQHCVRDGGNRRETFEEMCGCRGAYCIFSIDLISHAWRALCHSKRCSIDDVRDNGLKVPTTAYTVHGRTFGWMHSFWQLLNHPATMHTFTVCGWWMSSYDAFFMQRHLSESKLSVHRQRIAVWRW